MKSVILYGTVGCHLCEDALALLQALPDDGRWQLREVDISDSDELLERYGIRIPVVYIEESRQELGWPFDGEQLRLFLV